MVLGVTHGHTEQKKKEKTSFEVMGGGATVSPNEEQDSAVNHDGSCHQQLIKSN